MKLLVNLIRKWMHHKGASNSSLLSIPVDWDFQNSDSESECIEALKVVESPVKSSLPSEASHTQGHSPSPGNWSSVNQFFPEGSETTSANPVLSSSSRSVAETLPSSRLNLEPVVETECDEVFDHQEKSSGEVFDHQTDTSEDLRSSTDKIDGYREETNLNYTPKMDTDTYSRKLLQIKCEVDRVDRKRLKYTKNVIRLVDQPECLAKLQKIEDAEELCQDKIFELIHELDENVEADEARIKFLRSLSDELRS